MKQYLFLTKRHSDLQPGLPLQNKEFIAALPARLKTGIEHLSGIAMDDVVVHYNSKKPAMISAAAYAQGACIYIATGQEAYLPHEAWHVVQQRQGRVHPVRKIQGGLWMNDDELLEKEADAMGTILIQNDFLAVSLFQPNLKRKTSISLYPDNIVQKYVCTDGEFRRHGHLYDDYTFFRTILPDTIFADQFTDLIITSKDYGGKKYGNTQCLVQYNNRWYDMDKDAGWERAPDNASAEIIIRIHDSSKDYLSQSEVIATLTHEWKLHGEPFYRFISNNLRFRDISSGQLLDRYNERNTNGYLNVREQHGLLYSSLRTTEMERHIAQIGRTMVEDDAERLYREYRKDVTSHDKNNQGYTPSIRYLFNLE